MLSKDCLDNMRQAATQAMQKAYAPYSHFQVGVCLRSPDGDLFSGCNVENSAYGLTACAEVGAISALVLSGKQRWSDVLIVSSGNKLCTPCGACRQRLFEFANTESVCHLCTLSGDYQRILFSELLPLPFIFEKKVEK